MIAWIALSLTMLTVSAVGDASSTEGQARPPGLVSYAEAARCAGLSQAASELRGADTEQGRVLYDVALYWSLAAMQAARAAGRDVAAAEMDQTRERIAAVALLSRNDPEARAALTRCGALAPSLDG